MAASATIGESNNNEKQRLCCDYCSRPIGLVIANRLVLKSVLIDIIIITIIVIIIIIIIIICRCSSITDTYYYYSIW